MPRTGVKVDLASVDQGHLKHDHRMDRCYLKGEQGDKINALAAAMGLGPTNGTDRLCYNPL